MRPSKRSGRHYGGELKALKRNPGLVPVTDDVYFIASRLKEIDQTYYVVYDPVKRRYEVHSDEQRGGSLCFVVPYGRLDARTVDYALKTRNASFCKAAGDWRKSPSGRRRFKEELT